MPKIVSDEVEIAAHWPLPRFGRQRIRYGTPFMVGAFLSLALIPGHYFLYEHRPSIFILLPFPLMAIVLAIWGASYYDGTSILFNRDHITLRRWFQQPVVVPVSQISRIVRLTVDEPTKDGTTPRPALFFFNPDGRCVLSLFSSRFDDRDLAQLWATIGIQPEGSLHEHVKTLKLNERFPGAFDKPAA